MVLIAVVALDVDIVDVTVDCLLAFERTNVTENDATVYVFAAVDDVQALTIAVAIQHLSVVANRLQLHVANQHQLLAVHPLLAVNQLAHRIVQNHVVHRLKKQLLRPSHFVAFNSATRKL